MRSVLAETPAGPEAAGRGPAILGFTATGAPLAPSAAAVESPGHNAE